MQSIKLVDGTFMPLSPPSALVLARLQRKGYSAAEMFTLAALTTDPRGISRPDMEALEAAVEQRREDSASDLINLVLSAERYASAEYDIMAIAEHIAALANDDPERIAELLDIAELKHYAEVLMALGQEAFGDAAPKAPSTSQPPE